MPDVANGVHELRGKMLHLPKSEASRISVKVGIAVAIRKKIEKLQLTQVEAAKRTGMGRTVITAIVNGNLARISTDRLIDVAQGLGLRVQLMVA
ncbi:MAG: Helix-turn-helix domain [Pseudomonadota bacterium]|jgi:predicted XRE-type DNA-binding protein